MEGLTRLVSESLARHGFDRPLDYRRLHWSRWFRCESHHSLLFVPSKPGVFAVAEEIIDLDTAHVETGAIAQSVGRKPEAEPRRMLAVTQFFEDDDMAFVLDRMLSTQNPMRARLVSGRYFVRFVVIEDQSQRRTICNALNQWMVTAAEKATGIGSHFATSLELTSATEYVPTPDGFAGAIDTRVATGNHVATGASPVPQTLSEAKGSGPGTQLVFSASRPDPASPQLDSGAATNIHHPTPLPSGF